MIFSERLNVCGHVYFIFYFEICGHVYSKIHEVPLKMRVMVLIISLIAKYWCILLFSVSVGEVK